MDELIKEFLSDNNRAYIKCGYRWMYVENGKWVVVTRELYKRHNTILYSGDLKTALNVLAS